MTRFLVTHLKCRCELHTSLALNVLRRPKLHRKLFKRCKINITGNISHTGFQVELAKKKKNENEKNKNNNKVTVFSAP
jgi:hypothetical protein